MTPCLPLMQQRVDTLVLSFGDAIGSLKKRPEVRKLLWDGGGGRAMCSLSAVFKMCC